MTMQKMLIFFATRDDFIAAAVREGELRLFNKRIQNDPARQMSVFYQHESMSNNNFIAKITRNASSFQ